MPSTRVIAKGLGLATLVKTPGRRDPVRYNALILDGRLVITGVVDDLAGLARGLDLALKNRSRERLFPDYHLSARDLGRLRAALTPAPRVEVGGRAVPATWTFALTGSGSFRFTLTAAGVLEALQAGHGARLAIEGGDLVETVDEQERADRAARDATRTRQLAALKAAKPAILAALGVKRAPLVDDEDDGWPFLRVARRGTIADLLGWQDRLAKQAIVVAEDALLSSDQIDGLRVYAPMPARELVVGVQAGAERTDGEWSSTLGALVDALAAEAGTRVVQVDGRHLMLWPTKRRGKLTKSRPLLAEVCQVVDEGAEVSDFEDAIRAGTLVMFRWE